MLLDRKNALDVIMKACTRDFAIISTTGLISRDLYENYDSEQHFYSPGSMGLSSSIGLGIAINKPNKPVIIIDGDASLLMNLGTLVTIGHFAPKNLIHIVLDNGAYASCSEEPSLSNSARFDEIAKIVGYKHVAKVKNEKDLFDIIIKSKKIKVLSFILTIIELGGRRNLARPLNLIQIKERFKNFLCNYY